MGTRAASKIAVRFSKEWNTEWRARMWPILSPRRLATTAVRRRRAARPPRSQRARTIICSGASVLVLRVHRQLLAGFVRYRAHRLRCEAPAREMAAACNIWLWMASSSKIGTVVPYIGTVSVLSGFFTTVPTHKRARGVEQISLALNDCLAILTLLY